MKRPSTHPFVAVHMGHAAQQNMVITMRCGACSREAHHWAADLVKVLGMRHQVQIAPSHALPSWHSSRQTFFRIPFRLRTRLAAGNRMEIALVGSVAIDASTERLTMGADQNGDKKDDLARTEAFLDALERLRVTLAKAAEDDGIDEITAKNISERSFKSEE